MKFQSLSLKNIFLYVQAQQVYSSLTQRLLRKTFAKLTLDQFLCAYMKIFSLVSSLKCLFPFHFLKRYSFQIVLQYKILQLYVCLISQLLLIKGTMQAVTIITLSILIPLLDIPLLLAFCVRNVECSDIDRHQPVPAFSQKVLSRLHIGFLKILILCVRVAAKSLKLYKVTTYISAPVHFT